MGDKHDSAFVDDIKGGILEDIVFYQLSAELDSKSRDIAVMKYCNAANKEIDVVVLDFVAQSVCLIEVKHSSVQTEGQIKNLCDPELCAEIERKAGLPIVNKAVVYLGKSGEFNGVLYINAETLLRNSKELTHALLRNANISKFSQIFDGAEHKGAKLSDLGENPAKFNLLNPKFVNLLNKELDKAGIPYHKTSRGGSVALYVKESDKKTFEAIKRKLIDKLNGREKKAAQQNQSRKPKRKKL